MSDQHPKGLLISGQSGVGKSFSLMNIVNQEGVLYLNCEGGKPLPFKNNFKHVTVHDPYEIYNYFDQIAANPNNPFHTVVIDTISFLMDRYETLHIAPVADGRAAWGKYAQFFKNLMGTYVAKAQPNVVFLGHNQSVLDEVSGRWLSSVPVKGALAKAGLEAYFTTVLVADKLPIKSLSEENNPLLTITDRDRELGYKHVFQTRTTKATVGDRIRTPYGLFTDDETYINNDIQPVLARLNEYYE